MKRWLVLIPILWIALTLRLHRLDTQDIWWDEARNIEVAGRSWDTIAASPELDIHPPIYFYLLHGWIDLVGQGEFGVRFLSVIPGVLLLPLLYQLGRRMGSGSAGMMAAGAGALAPFVVAEAQETRMYTWAYLWLTLAGISLWRWIRQKQPPNLASPIRRIAHSPTLNFALFSALALLTHYSTLFVLVPMHLLLAGWMIIGTPQKRMARLRRWMAGGLLTTLFIIPQLPRAWEQIAPYRNPTLTVPSLATYLESCWKAFTLGVNVPAAAAHPWLIGMSAILLAGLVIWLWRAPQRIHAVVLAFLLTVPLALYYVVLISRSAFAPRYISFIMPAYLLLIGFAIAGWLRLHRVMGTVVAIALITAIVPAQRSDYYDPTYFSDDTQGLIGWLEGITDPNDLVLFDVPFPWQYYVQESVDARYLFVDINTVAGRLTEWAKGRERVFWIRWFKSDTDPRGAVPWLLERIGQQEGQQDFRGYQVTWYRLPKDAVFTLAPGFKAAQVDFGEVRMAGYAFGEREASIGGETGRSVWAAIRWRVKDAQADYKVSGRLRDAEGNVIGQDDRFLISDRHLRARYWQPGEEAYNVYILRPTGEMSPGTYTITALVYHPDTLAAIPVVGGEGVEYALGTLSIR